MTEKFVTLDVERGIETVEVTIDPIGGASVETTFEREWYDPVAESVETERELAERLVERYLSERSEWSREKPTRPAECRRCGYGWEYTGESEKPTCPNCMYKAGVVGV